MQELLTVEEAAALLKIEISTLAKWRWSGKGPRFVKMEKKGVRYRPKDLDDYVESKLRGATISDSEKLEERKRR